VAGGQPHKERSEWCMIAARERQSRFVHFDFSVFLARIVPLMIEVGQSMFFI
jgi:hypothetical protein